MRKGASWRFPRCVADLPHRFMPTSSNNSSMSRSSLSSPAWSTKCWSAAAAASSSSISASAIDFLVGPRHLVQDILVDT